MPKERIPTFLGDKVRMTPDGRVDVLDALIRLLDSPAPDAQPDWD